MERELAKSLYPDEYKALIDPYKSLILKQREKYNYSLEYALNEILGYANVGSNPELIANFSAAAQDLEDENVQ